MKRFCFVIRLENIFRKFHVNQSIKMYVKNRKITMKTSMYHYINTYVRSSTGIYWDLFYVIIYFITNH